ncbi:unnamed protein product [Acanthoscelides obtectus]|nr:unnamed protein product [Acanthoscelides obtectus]CAK1666726.1 4-coumarate--CoA ligase-like 4 [Acanthoscelides obtectus]
MTIRKIGTCFLNYGSMYWGSAVQGLFLSIVIGMCRLVCSNFDALQFWELVDKYKVSGTLLTPFQITQLVKTGKPEHAHPQCLLRIITGGSSLANTYFFALQDMLPNTDILQSYGQTEIGILAAFQIHNKSQREFYKLHPDTVGLPIKGVTYKVVDPNTDEILGPNREGELRVKSKTVMNGYYNRSCANRYDKDGWFRTGDVVKYDDNFYFYVVDRLKEMLKYRGWHIAPAILELELSHHPAVKQSAVIGKPHDEDGDHPLAIIVLEEGHEGTTAKEIEEYIAGRVAEYQKLRGGVKFVKDIPLTPSGKIKRRELRRMVLDELR